MNAAVRAVEIDSHPESQVRNSQPHGIGRVAALDGLGAWSNLGRNVVFVGPDLRPRAVFDESAFTEDEASQYDLDVHAILDLPGAGLVLTLNHFGMVRAFDGDEVAALGPAAAGGAHLDAGLRRRRRALRGRGRTARRVTAAGATIGRAAGVGTSAPRRDARPARAHRARSNRGAWSAHSRRWAPDRVAVGGDAHVSIAAIDEKGVGVPLWDVAVEFEPAVLVWDGRCVWAAGSEADATVDDYDWEARHGGGFAALDPADGRIVVRGRFHEDLAWGAGGVAVVIVPGLVCGFGRRGEVHLFDRPRWQRGWARPRRSPTRHWASRTPASSAISSSTASIGAGIGCGRLPVSALRRTA